MNVLVAKRDANKIQKADMHIAINKFYSKITALFNVILLETVPIFCNMGGVPKFWLDEEMNILKQESMSTH